MKRTVSIMMGAAVMLAAGCLDTADEPELMGEGNDVTVIPVDEVTYQPLNPARGDASPQAGVLWGDITQDVPSGMLLKFGDGFSSPPHIHNITYRAIVISGAIHNDDPQAAKMWMEPGSYWTQPAGEPHITAAKPGETATAFLEILSGPYLVQGVGQEFNNGELPINLASRNLVWLSAEESVWINTENPEGPGPEVAVLWQSGEPTASNGSLLKLPPNSSVTLSVSEGSLKTVIIAGAVDHKSIGRDATRLDAGGYIASDDNTDHEITCIADDNCVLYLRTKDGFTVR